MGILRTRLAIDFSSKIWKKKWQIVFVHTICHYLANNPNSHVFSLKMRLTIWAWSLLFKGCLIQLWWIRGTISASGSSMEAMISLLHLPPLMVSTSLNMPRRNQNLTVYLMKPWLVMPVWSWARCLKMVRVFLKGWNRCRRHWNHS